MRRPPARPAAVAALLVLVLSAACSDGGDSDSQATPATTPPPTIDVTVAPATIAPQVTQPPTTTTVPGPASVEAATTGRALGDQVAQAEQAIRNPSTPPAATAAWGQLQQNAYRRLIDDQSLLPAALERVPAALRPTVQANVGAGSELRQLTKPRTSLPPWRIVEPAPAAELLGYYKAAGTQIGVPWHYLAAIHLVETRMGRIRGTSTAGAQGPMQFLPATWGQYGAGGDINDNRDAIFGAARLLKRNGAPGNMANALFNYNRSDRYVRAVTAYAEQMGADERAYYGYHAWQVYYRLVDGDRLLAVGYGT